MHGWSSKHHVVFLCSIATWSHAIVTSVFIILTLLSILGKTTSRAEVLRRCHPELERLLNFEAAHPFMNRHGLLTPQQENELTLPHCTHSKRVTTLLQWLPRCEGDFLDKFLTCLRESAIEVPCPAHRELADILQQALDEASNYSKNKGRRIYHCTL